MAYNEDHLLAFDRAGKITASVVPAILGVCPYTSRIEAWRRITGRAKPFEPNIHVQRGMDYEEAALVGFEVQTGNIIEAGSFICHKTIDWLGASPDGVTFEGYPVEVKCPVKLHTSVPINYYAQVQTQIEVMDVPLGWFYSYDVENSTGIVYPVLRCREWWDAAREVLQDFYEMYVMTDTPPPRLTSKEKATWDQVIFCEHA